MMTQVGECDGVQCGAAFYHAFLTVGVAEKGGGESRQRCCPTLLRWTLVCRFHNISSCRLSWHAIRTFSHDRPEIVQFHMFYVCVHSVQHLIVLSFLLLTQFLQILNFLPV